MKNSDRLKDLMRDRGLTVNDVAKLLKRKAGTIRNWRCGSQEMPDHQYELLKLKVAA